MKQFLKDFETFAVRGNAFELAIGVIIGAAFGQVTNTLANNIISPFVGLFLGGYDFSKLSFSLGGAAVLEYGLFIQAVINFVIIAFALFLLLRVLNKALLRRKAEEQKPAENPELKVLMEIRDELKKSA